MELFFHNYPQLIFLNKRKLKLFFLKKNKVPLIIHNIGLPPPLPDQYDDAFRILLPQFTGRDSNISCQKGDCRR